MLRLLYGEGADGNMALAGLPYSNAVFFGRGRQERGVRALRVAFVNEMALPTPREHNTHFADERRGCTPIDHR